VQDLASADTQRVAELQKRYDAGNAQQAPPSAGESPAENKAQARKQAAGKAEWETTAG